MHTQNIKAIFKENTAYKENATCKESIESLFKEHKNLISKTIWRNRPLLAALRLDFEDVSQELAMTMLSAIKKFDPKRSASLAAHIWCSLQYEILNIKKRHKPHGVTRVPKDCRLNFLYLDNLQTISQDDSISYASHTVPAMERYHKKEKYRKLSYGDDLSMFELSELLESLSELEAEVLNLKIRGHQIRRKVHKAALFADILIDPDIIFQDSKNENTALVCKRMSGTDEKSLFIVLKLAVSSDDPTHKNSTITAHELDGVKYRQYLRTKKIVYKNV